MKLIGKPTRIIFGVLAYSDCFATYTEGDKEMQLQKRIMKWRNQI